MTQPGDDPNDYPNDYNDDQDDLDEPKKSNEFAEMFAQSLAKPQKKLSVGDKIKGEILVLGKEDVFVSTGTNTDGSLSRRELIGEDGQLRHKVGDVLDLYVTQVKRDEIKVSLHATSKNIADDLEDAFDMMLPVEGRVVEICKGGVRVSVKGKIAFCPISQLDFARTETGEEFVGKKFEFLITQFSEGGRNIVVSRKKLLAESRESSHAAFGEEKREGTVVSGKVKKIETFGAFVEISPGIEGLLHVSEMAWSRVENPNDVVKVGQDIVVKVLKTENKDGKMKISLSLKQVGPGPWENLPAHIVEGATVEGKVIRCMKFGAFVEVAPGLEGLVPMSEMSYTKRVMTSNEVFKEGDKINVKIKEINVSTKRMSLSFKDAGEDPWAVAAEKFAVGKIVSGKVQRKEAYGLFVTLEEGVVALLPKSKTQDAPGFSIDKVKIGDQIIVQVGELRQSERRISLELPSDENRDDWKGFTANAAATGGSFATLGDKLQKALDKKKK
jgi:small subunit ribosomal protein S1